MFACVRIYLCLSVDEIALVFLLEPNTLRVHAGVCVWTQQVLRSEREGASRTVL